MFGQSKKYSIRLDKPGFWIIGNVKYFNTKGTLVRRDKFKNPFLSKNSLFGKINSSRRNIKVKNSKTNSNKLQNSSDGSNNNSFQGNIQAMKVKSPYVSDYPLIIDKSNINGVHSQTIYKNITYPKYYKNQDINEPLRLNLNKVMTNNEIIGLFCYEGPQKIYDECIARLDVGEESVVYLNSTVIEEFKESQKPSLVYFDSEIYSNEMRPSAVKMYKESSNMRKISRLNSPLYLIDPLLVETFHETNLMSSRELKISSTRDIIRLKDVFLQSESVKTVINDQLLHHTVINSNYFCNGAQRSSKAMKLALLMVKRELASITNAINDIFIDEYLNDNTYPVLSDFVYLIHEMHVMQDLSKTRKRNNANEDNTSSYYMIRDILNSDIQECINNAPVEKLSYICSTKNTQVLFLKLANEKLLFKITISGQYATIEHDNIDKVLIMRSEELDHIYTRSEVEFNLSCVLLSTEFKPFHKAIHAYESLLENLPTYIKRVNFSKAHETICLHMSDMSSLKP
jgi:hypothetical protein